MCGERPDPFCPMGSAYGSSPRVRGTLPDHDSRAGQQRFIPACAGNAGRRRRRCDWSPVHPRVCGERVGNVCSVPRSRGSSPRVRGTLRRRAQRRSVRRFIPACAGNARCSLSSAAISSVHPRVCGERAEGGGADHAPSGSSPRVRGTPPLPRFLRLDRRFIPACAGNALPLPPEPSRPPVHPRVCGERIVALSASYRSAGSSPRVRGTQIGAFCYDCISRFIPACAGNARDAPPQLLSTPVHPRVCGERALLDHPNISMNGSSPRVRGTQDRPELSCPLVRFIPACAGNAVGPVLGDTAKTVHPRVCGERVQHRTRRPRMAGSSPRVRGTRHLTALVFEPVRFIPACAGNA